MDLTLWAGFVLASVIIGLVPGPGVTAIVGYGLSAGRRTALAAVAGAIMGNAIAMSLSLAGAGAILSQSAIAFTLLKWIGAAYLVGIGLYAIFKARDVTSSPQGAFTIQPRAAFWGTLVVTALNPKTLIFFIAFAPQFISPDFDYWSQALILLATFCATVALTDGLYAVMAGAAAGMLRGSRVRKWAERIGGGVLVAAGVATAASRT